MLPSRGGRVAFFELHRNAARMYYVRRGRLMRKKMLVMGLWGVLSVALCAATAAQNRATTGGPVFQVLPVQSSIKFSVKASVGIQGTFDKWEARLTFPSPDVTNGKLQIKIQAASVNT